MGALNTFPAWKYFLTVFIIVAALIYALPNIFGEDPAVQISANSTEASVNSETMVEIEQALKESSIAIKSLQLEEDNQILVRFKDAETQLKAKEVIRAVLATEYTVALNLAPSTPQWLSAIGGKPMKLGLDLRGGVHFLMEVDVDSAVTNRMESYLTDIRTTLREQKLYYNSLRLKDKKTISITFKDASTRDESLPALRRKLPELSLVRTNDDDVYAIVGIMTPQTLQDVQNYTMEQSLTTLRNRVNELGVAEAVVQRQGLNQIVVELPGVQDTAQAKEIIGKTAVLKFRMRDNAGDIEKAVAGRPVPGSELYHTRDGYPVLLKKQVILTGDSITGATTGFDQNNLPAVNIRLGGGGIGLFKKTTRENVGNQMAVVYIETKVDTQWVNGEIEKKVSTTESIISLATINQPLGNTFQITGLSMKEAQKLALLLRAGALPATVSIVEERTVGPSLGKDNIDNGIYSIELGMLLVLIFMVAYYSVFGLIANVALVANLVLIVATLSIIGATLTLPGIAGIVLTVGMAVDANVLIFERIREELRLGVPIQTSISRGFDRAFQTIVDANITTLIVAVILFSVGTGPIKGFAVTLTIGLITSMFTAITGSRAIVNLLYGGKSVEKLRIGI